MPEIVSPDGRYMLAVQGDGNVVVYDRGRPVWDKWTHEANEDPGTPDPEPGVQDPRPWPGASIPAGRLIKVSDDDGVVNRTYSYWPNAWLSPDGVAFVFAATNAGPILYAVDVDGGAARFRTSFPGYGGTGEGMYWNADGSLTVLDGPRLRRLEPTTGDSDVVFDISDRFPECRLWQAHSSQDGQVHSATVQRIVSDGPYPNLGTVVWRRGKLHWFPTQGSLDESQIDASGDYLLVKDGDANMVVLLEHGLVHVIPNAAGALGHSDCGHGFAIGEDDVHGVCVRLNLRTFERRDLFHTWNMGHLSIRGGRCLLSDATDRVLSLVDMETGARQVLLDHGMRGAGYDYQVHASLSPCGRLATFVSNREAGRMEMFLLVVG